jgi:hypothetical protein
MLSFRQSDREAIEKDAFSSEGKSPQERMAMFADLMATVDAIVDSLPPAERRRRFWIAEQLDPRPDPWWKNFRAEALAEYQCPNSSS